MKFAVSSTRDDVFKKTANQSLSTTAFTLDSCDLIFCQLTSDTNSGSILRINAVGSRCQE